jgi:hypothetical protein
MNLADSVLLAIVDKLLIGVLILVFGFWLNARLEKLKGQIALQNAVAPNRGAAYEKLWALTEDLSPRGPLELSRDKCQELLNALRKWYYENGYAMYVSLDAADLVLKGLAVLERSEEEQFEPQEAKRAFSSLRTQLKVDMGVYTPAEANMQIPKAG